MPRNLPGGVCQCPHYGYMFKGRLRCEYPGTDWPDEVAETGDALLFRRAAVSEAVFRQLRRAHYRVDAEIDLHGLTAVMVVPALRSFLADALHHDARVARVIHGKGLRSGNRGPVLKLVASNYLRRVGAVLAFASAREVDGGSGAMLVLLK